MSATVAILPRSPASPPAADPAAQERATLATAVEALNTATAQLQSIQAPLSRLQTAIRHAETVERDLAEARASDQAAIAAWIEGGCAGLRPSPGDETLRLEIDLGLAASDAAAAKSRMPDLEVRYRTAIDRVRERQADRDRAVIALATALARQALFGFSDQLRAALAVGSEINGVGAALVARFGDSARPAAGAIATAVGETMRSIGSPPQPEPGRRLVETLLTDPDAKFEIEDQ